MSYAPLLSGFASGQRWLIVDPKLEGTFILPVDSHVGRAMFRIMPIGTPFLLLTLIGFIVTALWLWLIASPLAHPFGGCEDW